MRIFFIGGIFQDSQKDFILQSSKGVVQNAANVFQVNLLKGLDIVCEEGVEVINLPFVGSYPLRFSSFYFPSCTQSLFTKSHVNGVGFLNLPILKHFARFISLLNALAKTKVLPGSVFVIYSVHLPFIAAIFFAKKLKFHNSKICLVIPDLPEYMSDEGGIVYRVFKKVDSFLINKLLPCVDCYVLLTDAMAEKIGIGPGSFTVVEGVARDHGLRKSEVSSDKKIVFYSGTLARRYGVCDLIDAFISIKDSDCELWLCGEGDSKFYIESIAASDNSIKYFGQLPREEILQMQLQATILVNPRLPDSQYTKYSFPSKIMEYMVSGRPVVMYRLPGIPSEYFDYCFTPEFASVDSLKDCLKFVLSLEKTKLNEVGDSARQFVLSNKSYISQASKIKSFLVGKINEK